MNMKFTKLIKENKVISMGIFAVLIVSYLFISSKNKKIPVEASEVKQAVFVGTIKSDARLRAKNRVTVSAFADGDLSEIKIKVGDLLKKGQSFGTLIWDKKQQIQSPMDGVVTRVYRDSSGPTHRGEALVEVSDPDQLEVSIELLTSDAIRVQPNMPVKITGFGDQSEIAGKVSRISRAGFTKTSALGVEEERTEVLVEIPSASELKKLGHNYHVETEIEIERVENALVIPIGALVRTNDQWAVFKNQNGKAEFKTIQIKSRNESVALIEGGLRQGEQVILYPPDTLKDGSKIKVLKLRE